VEIPTGVKLNSIHLSPVGVIPKKNKPGKYRLIMDLSSPKKFSVNDGIDPGLSSLSYASIDHLSVLVLSLGRGAMLVKADIKEACHMIPVHPQDQVLLGMTQCTLIECSLLVFVQLPKFFPQYS